MKLTAHAYIVRGSSDSIEPVLSLLESAGIETKANPDLLVRTFTSFSIDDARQLRERAALRGVGEQGRVFVIAAPSVPADAQNALLKTFEDPPSNAKFFLIVPAPETLLPTLRSRMQTLDVGSEGSVPVVDTKLFLKSPPEKRIEMLKPLLEKGDDDRRDLSGTLAFLSALESELSKHTKDDAVGIKSVYRARKYITDRGALAKALLEQVALLTPKVL